MSQNQKLSLKNQNIPAGEQLLLWQKRFQNIINVPDVNSTLQAQKFGYMAYLRDRGDTLSAFSTADKNAFFAALSQI